ncbi:unnamed protein product [Cuscuta epithymum]|uniref:Uncharacterized protein n=1 Tax=Cuscuta epithymum TaxID=186058 RepID=A0AAV0CKE8_9ASTE|nr:unnamed protein product [Cuscuta epithymum]
MWSDGGDGRVFWAERENFAEDKVKGIVVLFAWISVQEAHLKNYINLYSSLGWNSLVCFADFVNTVERVGFIYLRWIICSNGFISGQQTSAMVEMLNFQWLEAARSAGLGGKET